MLIKNEILNLVVDANDYGYIFVITKRRYRFVKVREQKEFFKSQQSPIHHKRLLPIALLTYPHKLIASVSFQ
jgi:hypothetical protein